MIGRRLVMLLIIIAIEDSGDGYVVILLSLFPMDDTEL